MSTRKLLIIMLAGLFAAGCEQLAPKPFEQSAGHIRTDEPAAGQPPIPDLVQQAPELPEPGAPAEQEKYTVVVHEVPVNEILFALARDAQVNVDIDPRVTGMVTLNAVDQTLPQLLERISRQAPLRYEMRDGNLFIMPDEPYFKTYKVDYVNMSRDSEIKVKIDTTVSSAAGGGAEGAAGGGSSSSTEVESISNNRFWSSLIANVLAILSKGDGEGAGGGAAAGGGELPVTENVIPHAESGLLTVRATAVQHKLIQELIDSTITAAHRQVMIQATIVEVTLNKDYQAGIDWSFLSEQGKAGFNLTSLATTAAAGVVPEGTVSSFILSYIDPNTGRDRINATVRLLEEFGDVNVLSSPQIMALNNQTAVLKVVDNEVYYSVDIETIPPTDNSAAIINRDSEIHTVPVGIVLSVTPQITESDSLILQVRPTISRVREFLPDPVLPRDELNKGAPVIQTREMESVLRMNNGQIAVLGGLMEDRASTADNRVPGLSRLPLLGDAFTTRVRDHSKSELVVFLRPVIVRNPSLEADLSEYKTFLQRGP